ncbi:MAG: hypothetical protein JXB29_07825 [Sedimentisphaerales bacterium]|nr:hypothetical protein [Sedimentisphaerales bacterium]
MPEFAENGAKEPPKKEKTQGPDMILAKDKDLVMEQILENINSTPIGQVLKKIASLPQGRREKVLDVRQRLTEGKYEINERLDIALEKVLEELIS